MKLKSEILCLRPHRTNQAGPIALASQNHVSLIATNHTSQHQACGDDRSASIATQGIRPVCGTMGGATLSFTKVAPPVGQVPDLPV